MAVLFFRLLLWESQVDSPLSISCDQSFIHVNMVNYFSLFLLLNIGFLFGKHHSSISFNILKHSAFFLLRHDVQLTTSLHLCWYVVVLCLFIEEKDLHNAMIFFMHWGQWCTTTTTNWRKIIVQTFLFTEQQDDIELQHINRDEGKLLAVYEDNMVKLQKMRTAWGCWQR